MKLREFTNKQKNKQYLVWPPFNTASVLSGGDSQTLLGLVSLPEEHGILMEIRFCCCCWLTLHFVNWLKKNQSLLFLKTFLVYSNFSYICKVGCIYWGGWQGSMWGILISDQPWKWLRWALTPQRASAAHVVSVSVAHELVNRAGKL